MAAERQAKGTVSYWYWGGSALVFLLLLSLQVAWFYAMRGPERERALAEGQRLLYSIKTGELMGAPAEKMQPEDLAVMPEPEGAEEGAAHPAEMVSGETATPSEVHEEGAAAVAASAMKRWEKAARPYTAVAGKPKVAIIVTGLGLSRSTTEQAYGLPADVSLSFSPYAHDIAGWVEKARAAGFETWLDMPMEPEDYPYSDPGPQGLLVSQDGAAIRQRVKWVQDRVKHIVGLVSPVKEKFTEAPDAAQVALSQITQSELLFVRGKPGTSEPYAKALGASGAVPMPQSVEIDGVITASDIDRMLDELVKKAKADGMAVGIARPYPVTMRQINAWVRTLEAKGVVLVPASGLAPQSQAETP